MALTILQEMAVRLGLDQADFRKGLQDAGKQAGDFERRLGGTGQTAREFQRLLGGVGSEAASLAGRFGGLVTSLGPVALGLTALSAGAISAANSFRDYALRIRDLSLLAGASTKDTATLVSGLEEIGVSSEQVEGAIARMTAALEGDIGPLNKLGISLRDASGQQKTALQLFEETVTALAGMQNGLQRNAIARELWGRGWTQMLPVLSEGIAKVKQMGAENAALGKTMDEQGIKKAEEYQRAVNNLGDAWEGMWVKAGAAASKVLVPVFNFFSRISEAIANITILPDVNDPALRALQQRIRDMEQARGMFPGAGRPPGEYPGAEYLSSTPPLTTHTGQTLAELQREITQRRALAEIQQRFRMAEGATVSGVLPEQQIAKIEEAAYLERLQALERFSRGMEDIRLQLLKGDLGAATDAQHIARLQVALTRERNAKLLQIERERLDAIETIRLRADLERRERFGTLIALPDEVMPTFPRMMEGVNTILAQQTRAAAGGHFDEGMDYAKMLTDEMDEAGRSVRYFTDQQVALTEATDELNSKNRILLNTFLLGAVDKFGALSIQIQNTRAAMEDMLTRGVDVMEPALRDLMARLTDLEKLKALEDGIRSVFDSVGDSISKSVDGVIQGTQDLEHALENFAQTVLLSIINNIVRRGIGYIRDALSTLLYNELTSPLYAVGGGGIWGSVMSAIGSLFGIPSVVGTVTGPSAYQSSVGGFDYGMLTNFGGQQHGGVITRPGIAYFEGREPEAVIPLSRWGEIAGKPGGPMVMQTIHVYPGVPEAARREIVKFLPQFKQLSVDAVLEASKGGGAMSIQMGRRRR